MLIEIANAIVADVKARHSEGDCPVTRQHTVENLEDALLTIAALAPSTSAATRSGPPSEERTGSEIAAQRQPAVESAQEDVRIDDTNHSVKHRLATDAEG